METLDGVKKEKKFSRKKPAIERRKRALARLELQLKRLMSSQNEILKDKKSAEDEYQRIRKQKDSRESRRERELVDTISTLLRTLDINTKSLLRIEKEILILKSRI